MAEWWQKYAAACKPLAVDAGSIPARQPREKNHLCPGGEIGRRKGLKIPRGSGDW